MPLYLCAGTPRSGSTWLYNAMRLLLLRKFPGQLYACWIGELDRTRAAKAEAILIKLHESDDDLAQRADAILTCHRDLRDLAASISSMGWASDERHLLDHIRSFRQYHEYWSARADIDLSYADIKDHPERAVRAVAAALHADTGNEDIREIAKTLDATPNNRDPLSIHDSEYLTHKNHRNDGRSGRWRHQLSKELAFAITEEHRDWLIRMKYDSVV